MSTITIIGVIQGLFLSVSLFVPTTKKAWSLSRLFLGLLIFFLCLHCIDALLTHTKLFYSYPHFFAIKDPFILWYGPLLLLYVQSLVKNNFKIKWLHLLHLVPFVIFLFRIAPLYARSTSYKIAVLDRMYANYTNVRDVEINLIFNVHIFIYLLATLLILFNSYKKNRTLSFDIKKKDLQRIGLVLVIVFVIYTISMIRFWTSYNANTVLWMPLAIAALFFIIGYRSLQIDKMILVESTSFDTSGVERSIRLIEAFDQQMTDHQLFLNPNTDLNSMAIQLQTNRQYLSNAINDLKGMSFTKYLNQYRISKAKELLTSKVYSIYSLDKVAKDSGFNSLSTFQRAFKEFEGMSPSKYRAKNKVN